MLQRKKIELRNLSRDRNIIFEPMFKAKVNSREMEIIRGKSPDSFLVNGKEYLIDISPLAARSFHFICHHKSYTVEILSIDKDTKQFEIKVNNNVYHIELRDKYDELLHRLGMDNLLHQKANDLKAPMPGLVLAVHVTDGQEIKKGDSLITLEAMKMENNLKAPGDGTVKKVAVKKGQPVEKNEILIYF